MYCHGINDLRNQVPLGNFGLEEQNGGICQRTIVMQWP